MKPWEAECLHIHDGGTIELFKGLGHMELIIEQQRAEAARTLADIIRVRYAEVGYINGDIIEASLHEFFTGEILPVENNGIHPLSWR